MVSNYHAPYTVYSRETGREFDAREVPWRWKNGNIMSVRDRVFRVAEWCDGEMELGDAGITVFTVNGPVLAEPKMWIVKVDNDVCEVYTKVELSRNFRIMKGIPSENPPRIT